MSKSTRDEKFPVSSLSFLSLDSIRIVTETLSVGVMLVDADGVLYHVNQAAQLLHQGGGVPKAGFPLADVSPHDWVEVKKVLTTGVPQICSLLRMPMATVLVSRMPVMRLGVTVGVMTMMQDINNFNAALHEFPEFQNLAREFETAVEQFEGVFLSLNSRGIIRHVNSAYEKLILLGRQGLVGRHIEDVQRSPRHLVSLFNEAKASRAVATMPVALPTGKTLQGCATPSFDENGELFRVMLRLKSAVSPAAETSRPAASVAPKPSVPSAELQRVCHASGFTVHSSAMNHVVQQALKVSKTSSCVLITGESGVGKTMLASLIHNNSGRSSRPFVVINCGAIPEQLLESELFGYEKGAFTGANAHGKMGLIETADKGTLCLDEIGELQYSLQSKLLEVFEKKSFIRVGGTKRTSVDIRILAATNKNLAEEVEKGNFRRDLFYRLNVIPIVIPPLRERPEDIQAMIEQLISQYNSQNGASKKMSSELLRWLLRYPFRGNMRELVNIMEWLLVMSESDVLGLHDLPSRLQQEYHLTEQARVEPASLPDITQPVSSAAAFSVPDIKMGVSLKDAVAAFEKSYLEKAMKKYGSIQAVSDALDVHFSTLWRKLVKYDLVQNHAAQEKKYVP
ncbi:sigma 54-interacting transcriptional regulator [Mailhella sp.]|uniref:sigma 54-interacting transcriptional regulator n=1 Tax=Mailhella sp. TaxID=1981029 RepID=UPI003AB602F9